MSYSFAGDPPVMTRREVYRVTRWSEVSFLERMSGIEPVPLDYGLVPEWQRPLEVKNILLRGFTQKEIDAVNDWFRDPKRFELPVPRRDITIDRYNLRGVFPIKMVSDDVAECCIDHFTLTP